jgi:cbb3-type cytochrome oxidase subunit 3
MKLYTEKNSSIAKFYYQGAIDYLLEDNRLSINRDSSSSNISLILFLLFLILISILCVLRFFKRKRRNSADKNIREIMLQNHGSLKKEINTK